MNFHFILVKPSTPDNVGAAARAVKTMGFPLRLVDPCDHLSGRARALAHNAEDTLESAQVFPTLKDALADMDFAIGTTARKRHMFRKSHIPLRSLPDILKSKENVIFNAAVVFGAEENGLSAADILLCDILTLVPLAQIQPSLNLAQAVMVYAYELATAFKETRPKQEQPEAPEFPMFSERARRIFQTAGIEEDSLFSRKITKRMGLLSRDDIKLLGWLVSRLEYKLGLPKISQTETIPQLFSEHPPDLHLE